MDQEKWDLLEQAFKDDSKFNEEGYSHDSEFEGMSLMDWLNCSSVRPDWDMMDEFSDHGYHVFAVERDSFGWLIGGVRRENDFSRTICFG